MFDVGVLCFRVLPPPISMSKIPEGDKVDFDVSDSETEEDSRNECQLFYFLSSQNWKKITNIYFFTIQIYMR